MRELLQFFDAIYVINLPTRADRRAAMDAQLRRIGLRLGHGNVHLFEALRPEDQGDFPSIGARGCFMSHLGALKDACRRGLSSVLILEDDVDFAPGPHCGELLDCLRRQDWGFFYGGYRVESMPQAKGACVAIDSSEPVETAHFLGLHGRELLDSLVNYLEAQLSRPSGDPLGGPMHVDGSYSWFRREHARYATLLAVPPVAFQRPSRSDITSLSFVDRAWGLRFVANKVRTLRHAVRQGMR